MRLYRVLPWLPEAAPDQPGGPLYVSGRQGGSRIDNPRRYRVLYAADSAAGAVGEAFGSRSVWTEGMLTSRWLPGARRALVEYEADVAVLDLDDGEPLAARRMRPSIVASPDRETTQAWALAIFEEGRYDGVRWWSVKDSRWGVVGLWTIDRVETGPVSILSRRHPALVEAAGRLRRSWEN